jgi:hypothetical protein
VYSLQRVIQLLQNSNTKVVIAALELLTIICNAGEDNVACIFMCWVYLANKGNKKPLEALVGLLNGTNDSEMRLNVVSLANSIINFAISEDLVFNIIDHLEDLKFGDLCKVRDFPILNSAPSHLW